VNDDQLINEPGMQPLRRNILRRVLVDYEGFLEKRPGDPHARQQVAEAKRQQGELFLQMGQMTQAKAALEGHAVKGYEELLQKAPKDTELRFGLARARHV